MPDLPSRALHDRLLENLAFSAKRGVALSLPGSKLLDVDTFERRIMGAERRLVRIGRSAGCPLTAQLEVGRLVLLSSRNLDSYLITVASLWKRGLVPLLADADLSRAEIDDLVSTFRPEFCLLDRRADPPGGTAEDLGESLAGLHAWVPPPRRAGRAAPLGHAAILRLTSGTTGRPRAVVVTAAQLLADARNICGTMGLRPGDTMVAAIPLGHAYGFVHVWLSLVLQGTRPILLEQPLPALLVEALSGPGPLVLPGTPYLFDLLLQYAGRKRFRGLRLCLSAGAPLPERLSRAFKDRFGLPIRTFYGASECGGICYDRSRQGILPDGCVGTPIDGVRLELLPVDGRAGGRTDGPMARREPGAGAGRICVSSEAVAAGYLPLEPGGALQPGRFLTGDLGRLDEEGRLHLLGRIDRTINVGGRKVNPGEVEAVLRRVPGVSHAVVFGAPDRQRGQAVCACVVAARRLTRETILAACKTRLAPFKIPRRIEFVEQIPVTVRGKIDRLALAGLVTPAGPSLPRRPAATYQRS